MDIKLFHEKYNYIAATQVMRQYLDIKFTNLDCLLLFRMGDFYELFYEDAIIASKVLSISLTKRGKTGEDEIPMCGVPFHALENYLNKLLEENFKVAICEQMETPEEAKKRSGYKAVVKREVTRIITAGTLIEESLLDGAKPNYLATIVIGKNNSAVCYLDLSTSKFFVINISSDQVISEISRIKPSEVLLSEKSRSEAIASDIETALNIRITFQVDSFFAEKKCVKIIENYYNIASIEAIGGLDSNQISAVGSIIEYISLTQKANLPRLAFPKILNSQKFMMIDSGTRRNLELTSSINGTAKGSLFHAINYTLTKGGARLLYDYLSTPLVEITKINSRLAITDFFFKNVQLTSNIRKILTKISDLERILTRIQMQRGSPRDLLSIRDTIFIAEEIRSHFIMHNGVDLPENIEKMVAPLLGNSEIASLIGESIREDAPNIITEGEVIKLEFHPKINELHALLNNGRQFITKLRDKYRQETGIESLKISNNNVIGLFIDITARHSNKITDKKFIHRQTTVNSIRYTTEELQEIESKMLNAKVMLVGLEKEIYTDICNTVINNTEKLILLSSALSRLDVFLNFAFVADEFDYSLPVLTNDINFEVQDGRHPVVENFLKASNESFTGNNCTLNNEERIWLITGPNMAGKSTFLRQNALIAILAHIGSFVPATSATIGVVDKIFSRVGAGDDLTKGQSTFMVEMIETSAILSQSTNRSLVILDEVGRGTSTYDGVAIAWSVLEYIHDRIKVRCLFATHYHELTSLSDIFPTLVNYTISINDNDGKILFLHKIIKGFADRSYGVHVAQMAGLPPSVIRKASQLLLKFEKDAKKSSKEAFIGESQNLNLFDAKDDEIDKYKEIYDFCNKIDPNELSPKEALDILYKLRELSG
ncbi:MAG: DNA mismatch repair protein MutS [Rickettsiaceae bacterium]